jgi:hypothetical protein
MASMTEDEIHRILLFSFNFAYTDHLERSLQFRAKAKRAKEKNLKTLPSRARGIPRPDSKNDNNITQSLSNDERARSETEEKNKTLPNYFARGEKSEHEEQPRERREAARTTSNARGPVSYTPSSSSLLR